MKPIQKTKWTRVTFVRPQSQLNCSIWMQELRFSWGIQIHKSRCINHTSTTEEKKPPNSQLQIIFTLMQPPPAPSFQREPSPELHPCCDSLPSQQGDTSMAFPAPFSCWASLESAEPLVVYQQPQPPLPELLLPGEQQHWPGGPCTPSQHCWGPQC